MRASNAVTRARVWAPLLAGALVLVSAPFVRADSSTPAGKSPATTPSDNSGSKVNTSGVEEIVVTARKREENMQATPVAISAFTEADLVDKDIRRIDEITASVPTLQFDHAIGTANSSRVYLRGVGTGDPISTRDPGVGIYVDGVFLPRSQSGLLTVSDVQQVEVLRGPQGTLFGKNTIGGAVNITTRRPDPSEFNANLEARIGNHHRFDSRVSFNVPVVPERSAVRLSFATATADPITKNKATGRDFQDDKLLAGRFQFTFLPSDKSQFDFSIDRSQEHRVQFGGKCLVTNRRPNFNGSVVTGAAGVNGTELPGGLDSNGNGIIETAPSAASFGAVNGVALGSQVAILGSLATSQAQNNYLNACDRDGLRDERSVASDLSSSKDYLDTWGTHGTYSYDVSDDMTIKSITSFRHNDNEGRLDNDFTELNFGQTSLDAGNNVQDAYSQELQLTGSGFDSHFNYVVGLYGFKEEIDGNFFGGLSTQSPFVGTGGFTFRTDPTNQSSATTTFTAAVTADPTIPARFSATNAAYGTPTFASAVGLPGAITNNLSKIDNHGYAAYTQGTFDITDALSLTLGTRLTAERKRVLVEIYSVNAGFVGGAIRRPGELDFGFDRSARFKDISPMANLAYQISDDAMVYTTYAKGFKSGGFNGRANNTTLTNKIDDEKLTSYEVGFKSTMLDNKVRLNGAGYWTVYKDIQLTIPRGINNQASIQVLNVGKAEIKGLELEFLALILPTLELTTSLGVINSRYVEFDDSSNAFAKDRRLPGTPDYTGNIGLGYTLPPTPIGDVRFFTQWSHRGESGTDVADSRELRKDKNGELSGSITLALADGKTEISLFGKNLLNRLYFVNGVNLADSLGIAYRFYNDPRTYGLEVRRRF